MRLSIRYRYRSSLTRLSRRSIILSLKANTTDSSLATMKSMQEIEWKSGSAEGGQYRSDHHHRVIGSSPKKGRNRRNKRERDSCHLHQSEYIWHVRYHSLYRVVVLFFQSSLEFSLLVKIFVESIFSMEIKRFFLWFILGLIRVVTHNTNGCITYHSFRRIRDRL